MSIPCVVGSLGNGNWWVFAGFNGVNADDGGWNALGIDGGRIEGWIKDDDNWETVVGCWRSGLNVWILFVFCWNNNGEPLEGIWFKLFGAGKRGLNGVLAELRNEAEK